MSAKGSVKDNWKYTSKDGKVLTNFTEEETKGNNKEEIIIETLKYRIETNKFYKDWLKQIENDDDYHEAVEYVKYMRIVEKYTILSGSRTEIIKQLTKTYKAKKGEIKGIIILGENDTETIVKLQNGIIHDSNGNLLMWDNFDVPVRHIFKIEIVKIPKIKKTQSTFAPLIRYLRYLANRSLLARSARPLVRSFPTLTPTPS